jgi:hypothetical protein
VVLFRLLAGKSDEVASIAQIGEEELELRRVTSFRLGGVRVGQPSLTPEA